LKTFCSRWLPVIVWAAFIFLISANSDPYALIPERIFKWIYLTHVKGIRLTKIIGPISHVAQFAIFGFLLARAVSWKSALTKRDFWIVFLLSVAYALSDEVHQFFVPLRAFQLTDILMDSIGGVMGMLLYNWMQSKR